MTPRMVHGHLSGHLFCKMSSRGALGICAGHFPIIPEQGRGQRFAAVFGPFFPRSAGGKAPAPLRARVVQQMARECTKLMEAP